MSKMDEEACLGDHTYLEATIAHFDTLNYDTVTLQVCLKFKL